MGIETDQYFCEGDNEWNVKELWEASRNLQTEECWIEEIGLSQLSDDFVDNLKRVVECDLDYPIIVTPDWYVADGMHRLIKAMLMGREKIFVKHLNAMPKPTRIIVDRTNVY